MKCRFRTVLENREVECVFEGEHETHIYYSPKSGKKYVIKFVDLEQP